MPGLGNDLLTGGTGADTFLFAASTWGRDIIADFEDGTDMFDLIGSGFTFADANLVDFTSGIYDVVRVEFDNGSALQTFAIVGLTSASITKADFVWHASSNLKPRCPGQFSGHPP